MASRKANTTERLVGVFPLGQLPGDSAKRSQREQAYHQLRRLLILQQIPEGVRLPESGWSSRLNVNRAALREAFARLEAEGLIESGPKGGYFVPILSIRDIHEVLAVRLMLESGALETVCEAGYNTPRGLKPMRDACALLERLVREDYHYGVVEADWRFHEALIQAAGNRRLAIAYRHAPLPIIHPDIISGERWAARARRTIGEHRAILDAILAGEVAHAKDLLRTHLTHGRP